MEIRSPFTSPNTLALAHAHARTHARPPAPLSRPARARTQSRRTPRGGRLARSFSPLLLLNCSHHETPYQTAFAYAESCQRGRVSAMLLVHARPSPAKPTSPPPWNRRTENRRSWDRAGREARQGARLEVRVVGN